MQPFDERRPILRVSCVPWIGSTAKSGVARGCPADCRGLTIKSGHSGLRIFIAGVGAQLGPSTLRVIDVRPVRQIFGQWHASWEQLVDNSSSTNSAGPEIDIDQHGPFRRLEKQLPSSDRKPYCAERL